MIDEIKKLIDNDKMHLGAVSGGTCDLPSGQYIVGVDLAREGSKDIGCRTWMKKENGHHIIVANETF